MIVATDCWEYDIKAAGKTFLEDLGYKLSDKKDEYVVQVGLIFRDNKELQKQFYDELRKILLESLPQDIKVLRYYVDEVILDRRFQFPQSKYTIKEKHLKFLLIDKQNSFVKVYDDSVKISKSFPLQSTNFWNQVADILTQPVKQSLKQKELVKLVHKFLHQKFEPKDYLIITKTQKRVVVYESFIQEFKSDEYPDKLISNINKEVYYNLLFKYLHSII